MSRSGTPALLATSRLGRGPARDNRLRSGGWRSGSESCAESLVTIFMENSRLNLRLLLKSSVSRGDGEHMLKSHLKGFQDPFIHQTSEMEKSVAWH